MRFGTSLAPAGADCPTPAARCAERGRFIVLEVSAGEQVPGRGTQDERVLEKGAVKDGRIVAGDGEACQEVGRPE